MPSAWPRAGASSTERETRLAALRGRRWSSAEQRGRGAGGEGSAPRRALVESRESLERRGASARASSSGSCASAAATSSSARTTWRRGSAVMEADLELREEEVERREDLLAIREERLTERQRELGLYVSQIQGRIEPSGGRLGPRLASLRYTCPPEWPASESSWTSSRARTREAPSRGACVPSGLIPGVLYGAGKKAHPFAVEERELRRVLTGEHGLHAILDVVFDGQKTRASRGAQGVPARPRAPAAAPHRPARGAPRPVDPDAGRRRAHRRVAPASRRAACSRSSSARSTSRRCRWRCPTGSSSTSPRMTIGDSLRVADIVAPEGVKLLDDPDAVVADRHAADEGRGARGRGGGGARGRGGRSRARPRARMLRRPRARPRARAAAKSPPKASVPCASSVGASRPRRSTCSSRGSGNPGREYARTRHNVGHMVARRAGAPARRLVSLEVLRRARRAPARRRRASPS